MIISTDSSSEINNINFFEFHSNTLILYLDNFFYLNWKNLEEKNNLKQFIEKLETSSESKIITNSLAKEEKIFQSVIISHIHEENIDTLFLYDNKTLRFKSKTHTIDIKLNDNFKKRLLNDSNWNN